MLQTNQSFQQKLYPESYFLELADGGRSNNIVLILGNARISFEDSNENIRNCIFMNRLHFPTFKQDIF